MPEGVTKANSSSSHDGDCCGEESCGGGGGDGDRYEGQSIHNYEPPHGGGKRHGMRGGGGDGDDYRHPSLDITCSYGTQLSARRIVLCICGSVAAYRAIDLARLLMRHGADVRCVLSGAAARLIRPDYFGWATGNRAVTKLTGGLEHIGLADYGMADMIIVYPATANTLGKLANGIDDGAVSTVLAVGFGSGIPILACPAMHEAMYESPAITRNMQFLRDKIMFLDPQMIEGKAKAAEPEEVLGRVLEMMMMDATSASSLPATAAAAAAGTSDAPPFRNCRVLITAGPTIEPIDPVRSITNTSTGRTGTLLASKMISEGADVTLVYGPGTARPSPGANLISVRTGAQMLEAVTEQLQEKFDIIIMAAAAPDYTPESVSDTKIKSDAESLTIRLRRAPKIIDRIRQMQPEALIVGFKAEADVTRNDLVMLARKKMAESGADIIIANDIGATYQKDTDVNEVVAVHKNPRIPRSSSGRTDKQHIAGFIIGEIRKEMASG